jgi:tetratricopeptide (TPR) repeat protein
VRSRLLAIFLGSTVAFASPQKAVRKPPPPDLTQHELANFADAVVADKAGDDRTAEQEWEGLLRDKPHAHIFYNLADLYRRTEQFEDAVKAYKKYLELAPKASDRAAVEKLIAQIEKRPMSLVVDGEDFDAVVFIDGKVAGPSPLVTTLSDGWHVVDRIGPASYTHRDVFAGPMDDEHVTSNHEEAGNVILSSTLGYGGRWKDGPHELEMNSRFTLPPGRYDTFVFQKGRTCTPLSFVVPPGNAVVYVYIEAARDHRDDKQCLPIKVHAQKLQFPAVKK